MARAILLNSTLDVGQSMGWEMLTLAVEFSELFKLDALTFSDKNRVRSSAGSKFNFPDFHKIICLFSHVSSRAR